MALQEQVNKLEKARTELDGSADQLGKARKEIDDSVAALKTLLQDEEENSAEKRLEYYRCKWLYEKENIFHM